MHIHLLIVLLFQPDEVHNTLSPVYPNLVTAYPNESGQHTKERKEEQQICLGSVFSLPQGTTVTDYKVLFVGKDGRTFTNYLLELAGKLKFL